MRGYFFKSLKGFSFILMFSVLFSCGKKCNPDFVGTRDSGDIVANSKIKPQCGGLMYSNPDSLTITGVHPYAGRMSYSINDSEIQAVDYSQYSVLSYPLKVNTCAGIEREVTIDNTAQTVLYKIKISQCGDSPESVYLENYVLVPKVDGYQVTREVEYNNI